MTYITAVALIGRGVLHISAPDKLRPNHG
jgi:hypothetical protein